MSRSPKYSSFPVMRILTLVAVVLLIVLVQLFQTIGTAIATHSDKRLRK